MNNHPNKTTTNISKKSVVLTPSHVSKYIYDSVKRHPYKKILDIGCWDGSMSKYFSRKKNSEIIGLDIDNTYSNNFDKFIHQDFLSLKKKDIDFKPDLILTNPPFNDNYPFLFLEKIIELWGSNVPIIMISGHWFSSGSSKRMEFLNTLKITKKTTLHKRTFEECGVSIESDIIYINIKQSKNVDFLDISQVVDKKQKFKTVALSVSQVEWIQKNIPNFSKEIKEYLSLKYADFPKSPRG